MGIENNNGNQYKLIRDSAIYRYHSLPEALERSVSDQEDPGEKQRTEQSHQQPSLHIFQMK